MIDKLRSALADRNVQAFLRVIRAGEGTSDEDGYRRHFGGELFTDFSQHPKRAITKMLGDKPITSTAAGAYQFLSRTWAECQAALGLPDFGPASQDLAAVFLIARRNGLEHVLSGRLEQAIAACAAEWASLPGSPYGQPTKTLAQCRAVYEAHGGTYAPAGATTPQPAGDPTQYSQEAGMPLPIPAIVAALLPSVIEAVPKLGALFKGGGSEVAQRNMAAATTVLDIVQKATNTPNAQAAVEAMQADPVARTAAAKAIEDNWYQLTEAGGGGIEGARKADVAMVSMEGPWWTFLRSPSFWMLLLSLPLVYIVVGSISGLWGHADWSSDVRASLATAVVSLIVGGAAGYFWGQTTSRNRAPAP